MDDENNTGSDNRQDSSRVILPAKKTGHRINKGGLIVLFAIIVLAVLAGALGVLDFFVRGTDTTDTIRSPDITPDDTDNTFGQFAKVRFPFSLPGHPDNYIAVLHIEGVIEDKNRTYNQSWLLSTIDDLKADEKNRAIMLYIDSPGGGVYQADEVYLALKNYRKTGKPLYAYMGPLAASGGYYIACAADTISANRNTLTGSIGVIAGQSLDLTGLMGKLGIKSDTITAGKNKNMMNFNAPFTDEQKAIMQSIADEAYDQFTGIVAENRKLPLAKVRQLADGRIYTAHQALENGLIDSICTWEEAVDQLENEKKVGQNCGIKQFRVDEKPSLYDYITGTASAIHNLASVVRGHFSVRSITEALIPRLPYPAYYCQR